MKVRRIHENKKTIAPVKRIVGAVGNRQGDKNPNWRGGVHKIGSYYRVYAPGHKKAIKYRDTPYVLRATVNLEKKIGRKLKKHELPHHSDHIKINDTSRNLKLITSADHRREHSKGLSNQQRSFIAREAVRRTSEFEKQQEKINGTINTSNVKV